MRPHVPHEQFTSATVYIAYYCCCTAVLCCAVFYVTCAATPLFVPFPFPTPHHTTPFLGGPLSSGITRCDIYNIRGSYIM